MTEHPPDHLQSLLKPGVDHEAEAWRCRRLAASISEGPAQLALYRLADDHAACRLYLDRTAARRQQ